MKEMLLYIILLSLKSILGSGIVDSVHQDTLLTIDSHGVIEGLPTEFTPARLDIETYTLQLGQLQSSFPPCIASKISGRDYSQLTLTASWYHSKELLPYYMHISPLPDGDYSDDPLLVDLETLELIHLFEDMYKGDNARTDNVAPSSTCDETYNRSITRIKN